jgi:hypothetical protein
MSSSRRKFIRNAASGTTLAWSSLRLAVGTGRVAEAKPGAPTVDRQTPLVAVPARHFLYGTQFFRPPSPTRAMRREMLENIAEELKFNLIRLWPNWDYMNPEPEKWIFDEVEQLMSYCDELGLQVLCGLMYELQPWCRSRNTPWRAISMREAGPRRSKAVRIM